MATRTRDSARWACTDPRECLRDMKAEWTKRVGPTGHSGHEYLVEDSGGVIRPIGRPDSYKGLPL